MASLIELALSKRAKKSNKPKSDTAFQDAAEEVFKHAKAGDVKRFSEALRGAISIGAHSDDDDD